MIQRLFEKLKLIAFSYIITTESKIYIKYTLRESDLVCQVLNDHNVKYTLEVISLIK